MKWIKIKINNFFKTVKRLRQDYEQRYKVLTCLFIGSCISSLYLKPLISCSTGLNSYLNLHKFGGIWIDIITFFCIFLVALIFGRAKQRLILLWLKNDNHEVKKIAENLNREESCIWKILTFNIIVWLLVVIFFISPWLVKWSCNLGGMNWFTVIGGLIVGLTFLKKPEKNKQE